jgi:hypothetical protein
MWLLNQTVPPGAIEVPLKFELIMLNASARADALRAASIKAEATNMSRRRVIFFTLPVFVPKEK